MKRPSAPSASERLKLALAEITSEASSAPLSAHRRRRLDSEMREAMAQIGKLLHEIDPIRQPAAIFDPANPKVIGRFVALALVAQPRVGLGAIDPFYGSGVYAIYYNGSFPAYAPIKRTETPIYVGQAAPTTAGARTPMDQGDKLTSRLKEHRRNIARATSTLDVKDFECRTLVVQSGWETAAEDYLIHLFRPIWNKETKILYGLGKHGDAAETRQNKRSPWDTLHPARTWAADTTQDARSPAQIQSDLTNHFGATRIYRTLDEVLHDFVEELRQI